MLLDHSLTWYSSVSLEISYFINPLGFSYISLLRRLEKILLQLPCCFYWLLWFSMVVRILSPNPIYSEMLMVDLRHILLFFITHSVFFSLKPIKTVEVDLLYLFSWSKKSSVLNFAILCQQHPISSGLLVCSFFFAPSRVFLLLLLHYKMLPFIILQLWTFAKSLPRIILAL